MQCTKNTTNLFWFRRDLRLFDNHGLYESLIKHPTVCCFIWDKSILGMLQVDNPRVGFIQKSIVALKRQLINLGSDLIVLHGNTKEEIEKLVLKYNITTVYCNEDYEPFAIARDVEIKNHLAGFNVDFQSFKDHVIFAKREILNNSGNPYSVYTHYKKTWLNLLTPDNFASFKSLDLCQTNLLPLQPQLTYYQPLDNDFQYTANLEGGEDFARNRLAKFIDNLANYHSTRDYPALNLTSYLGVDLRFGTISVRQLVQIALNDNTEGSSVWLIELIWRDFFSQILFNYPHVVNKPFHLKYEKINYENNEEYFKLWCEGKTGFPIVDAGMRQLNQTGFMHNRVRMICASFLCKDLLIDWRWGEKYFAMKLLDYDLASNNGNWQWCASTGCDAQPYFRIFNPYTQSERFDPDGRYIKKFVPELAHLNSKQIHCPPTDDIFNDSAYILPIINHKHQTEKAKLMFKILTTP